MARLWPRHPKSGALRYLGLLWLALSCFTVAAQDLKVVLEEPVDGEVASGISNIRGWAIASEGISTIEIFIDGQFAFTVPYGGERKDVENANPDVANSLDSGFGQTWNYGLMAKGTHTLTARAISSTGNITEDSHQFTVVGLPESFYPKENSPSLQGASVRVEEQEEQLIIENLKLPDDELLTIVLAWNVASQGFQVQSVNDYDTVTPIAGRTDPVGCYYADITENNQLSLNIASNASWSCGTSDRDLVANGIPDHEVGEFPNPNNPNAISAQDVRETFTLAPSLAGAPTYLGGRSGPSGYVLNGVKIDPGTAGSCFSANNCSLSNPRGDWHIEALGQSHFDFGDDENNAHVQPGGAYHYHGMPEGFLNKLGATGNDMVLIGWASDGFPIYARWGYDDPDSADSDIRVITSSYQLRDDPPADRPSTDLYELGTFTEDWEYQAGSGDLDECNGRFGVTPDFPAGIYHYYATDTYPYFQRCVSGSL